MNIWNKLFKSLIFSEDRQARILSLCLVKNREPFYAWAHSPYNWNTKFLELDWEWNVDMRGNIHFGDTFNDEWEEYCENCTCADAQRQLKEFYKQYKQGLL